MLDGAELALAPAAHPGDVDSALAEFDQKMFPRSTIAALDGIEMQRKLAEEDAARILVDFMAGSAPE